MICIQLLTNLDSASAIQIGSKWDMLEVLIRLQIHLYV